MSTSLKAPIIGVTSEEIKNLARPWAASKFGQTRTYIESIMQAGGAPVLLPLTEDESILRATYELLDGLCLAGGVDLGPALYGQKPYAEDTGISPLRDKTEQVLMRWALQDKLPILAICRGMHLINVEFGGTLHQDIPTDVPASIDHEESSKRKTIEDLSHTLSIKPGSRLADILGTTTIGSNGHHHQAINKLGKGVEAAGWAGDGLIEAIELHDLPYFVGVQCHPESLTRAEPRWAKLFESFVEACAKNR
jgi:putative glutamine amidotransferase